MIDDDGGDPLTSETEVVSSRPGRWGVGIVVAVAGLVIVAVLTSGGGGDGAPAPTSTTTAARSSTTVVAPSAPNTNDRHYLKGEPAPVFADQEIPGWLLLGSESGNWRELDLATGSIAPVPPTAGLGGIDPRDVVPVRGGIVFMDGHPGVPRLLTLPTTGSTVRTPVPISADLSGDPPQMYEVIDIRSAGLDDAVWLISLTFASGRERERQATLVDMDGRVVMGPFAIPAHPVAGSARGMLFNAGAHGYLVNENGITDLGAGEVIAATAQFAGRIRCNLVAQCHQEIVHLDAPSGARVAARFPTDAAAAGSVTMALAVDGSVAALPASFGSAPGAAARGETTSMYVTPAAGSPTRVVINNARSAPLWLPNGEGLVILTGLGLQQFTVVDGELASTPAAVLPPEDTTGLVYVSPRKDEP